MSAAPGGDPMRDAFGAGRVMAQAVRAARELVRSAEAHPGLFAADAIDATTFNALACANAFAAAGVGARGMRVLNRTALWLFGLDWLVDHKAAALAEIEDINGRVLAVLDGAAPLPGDVLTPFLAEIRDEVSESPAFPRLRDAWRDALVRVLDAGAREWEWKAAAAAGDRSALPSLDAYLDNADNIGSAWVNLSHWIALADPATVEHVAPLREADREVQKALRLLNDLATYERDLAWNDLNALMLVDDRAAVSDRLDAIVRNCRALLEPLRDACPDGADYLARQLGFNSAFYGASDYWGSH
ncbi:terpene synthase family protein [Actinomadura sp. 21ATH]|uniref:terpene synthase family protein n=1 Tax=Actinomadura sp. 21ATH TaxID=1735444 RepID=UPI0035BFB6D0